MIAFLYKRLVRPILFAQDPEKIHDVFVWMGARIGSYSWTRFLTRALFSRQNKILEQEIAGLQFRNPVGLSAGFDKEADLPACMQAVGFGFSQVGSITKNAYVGNPYPRLYRLKKSKAIVVYYGLKNLGVEATIEKMKHFKLPGFPVSASVAKTNCKGTVSTEEGIEDYCASLKLLQEANCNDFYTINISCPNTYGGEPFTTPERLTALLESIETLKLKKPVFVKMPINLRWKEFRALLDVIEGFSVTGLVIGNLNKNHQDPHIKDKIPGYVKGGISGLPCQKLSNELISKTYKYTEGRLVIIGVGGIFSADDAYEKICRGASLVQVITGMIYEGPQLIGSINRGIVKRLKKDGFAQISEAVGSTHR